MPSQSKAQQRFMGMVHATQKGDMENPSPEVEKAADSMSDTDAKDFASTSHKELPDKIKEMVLGELRSVKAIQTDYSKVLDAMEKHLDLYKKSKGTPEQQTHLEHLKKLTTLKKKYSQELENKVKGIYTDADLEINEMGSGDVHFKRIMQYYNDGTPSVKKQVAIIVSGDKNASKSDIIKDLHQMGYDEIQETEEELGLSIEEMTTSDAAGEYNTPFAFGKPEDEKTKGKRQADLTGYSVVVTENRWLELKRDEATAQKLVKPLGKARPKITSYYSNLNEETAPINKLKQKMPNHVKSWAKYVAQHEDGEWWFYDDTPKLVPGVGWKSYDSDGHQWSSDVKTNSKNWEKSSQKLNENRWLELKRDESTAQSKIGRGISNINKQLAEMERFLNWYGKIKNESGVNNKSYWKRTNSNIYTIKERLLKLDQKIRQISE